MTDGDVAIKSVLEQLFPAAGEPNWSEVMARAGGARPRSRMLRPLAVAITLAALIAIIAATPLGAEIAHSVGGFSSWISGEPGKPASKAQQKAFARANAHSYLGFPASTQLRILETRKGPTGREVQLFGFRAGRTLCLRVVVAGKGLKSNQTCAPLAELQRAGAPVRVVMVDDGFGTSKKRAWYGIDRVGASAVQVTAGIAADGVKAVRVHDSAGTHLVQTASNAFLYVSWSPKIGQRVDAISAITGHGLVDVPFAPAPFGGGGGIPGSGLRATGPTKVQRVVKSGTVSWLVDHRNVGQPLSALRGRIRLSLGTGIVFGRLLAPNPALPLRFALTLSMIDRSGPIGRLRQPGLQVCGMTITATSAGGGCSPLKGLFSHGPIAAGSFLNNGSDEFMLVAGFVSDDVHRLVVYLASGGTQPVALDHNTYVVSLARARFPIRLVAYDKQGRIIGITSPIEDFTNGPAPAPGLAHPLLHATSPSGATGTLLVGRSNAGGECYYVRYYQSKRVQGATSNCMGRAWHGSAVQLGGGGPVGLWYGRVRADVTRVEVTFGDGRVTTIRPTKSFVLYAVPATERGAHAWVRRFDAYNGAGQVVGSEKLKRP